MIVTMTFPKIVLAVMVGVLLAVLAVGALHGLAAGSHASAAPAPVSSCIDSNTDCP